MADRWTGRWSRCRGSPAPRGTAPGEDRSDHLGHVRSHGVPEAGFKYLVAVPVAAVETPAARLVSRVERGTVVAAWEPWGQVHVLGWGTTHVSFGLRVFVSQAYAQFSDIFSF